MNYKTIDYNVRDKILTITLDRPDRMNAFTDEMAQELINAFDQADADDEVRAIVVTGRGKAFCAGMDLVEKKEGFNVFALEENLDLNDPASLEKIRDTGGMVTLRIFDCKKPVIAAINGAAVGIGLTMTLAMDIRLASPKAKLGFVFSQRGIVNEACSSWFLPRVVGVSQALEWVYTGKLFTAEEGHQKNLIRSVHDGDDLLAEAYEIARSIAENTSPMSVALCRQMIYKMMGANHPMQAHKIDSRAMYATSMGADGNEGINSFLEKRPPQFTTSVANDMPDFYPWWETPQFD